MSTTATRTGARARYRVGRPCAERSPWPLSRRSSSLAAPAGAVTKNGITPSRRRPATRSPSGRAFVFKLNVQGPERRAPSCTVCKSKRKDADGIICHEGDDRQGRSTSTARASSTRRKFFDFPGFWLNSPGTYYWQAYRIALRRGHLGLPAEGPIVKFKVG